MRPHISLNVRNVSHSVEFYKKIFGTDPQKQTSTYAKFDLKNPSLNFTLQSGGEISRVSHLGIEVDSPEEVQVFEKRFKDLGLLQYSEKDVDCCFARQDKAWVKDPDGNPLEVFYVAEQLPVNEAREQKRVESSCCAGGSCG